MWGVFRERVFVFHNMVQVCCVYMFCWRLLYTGTRCNCRWRSATRCRWRRSVRHRDTAVRGRCRCPRTACTGRPRTADSSHRGWPPDARIAPADSPSASSPPGRPSANTQFSSTPLQSDTENILNFFSKWNEQIALFKAIILGILACKERTNFYFCLYSWLIIILFSKNR